MNAILPAIVAVLAVAFAVTFAVRRKGAAVWLGAAALFGLFAAGGAGASVSAGAWLAGGGAGLLAFAFAVVVGTRSWSPAFGWFAAGMLAFGLGGLVTPTIHAAGVETIEQVRGLRPGVTWWWAATLGVLAIVLVPAIITLGIYSLSGLSPFRRTLAIAARCLLVLVLLAALADPLVRRTSDATTVIFLVDRSLSIPPEADPSRPGVDMRWQHVKAFINGCATARPNPQDEAGVIVFGRRPRLVLPPSPVKKLPIDDELITGIDPQYTDIAAALKLGLASFSEGTNRRVVLLSDGNENLGNAVEQARSNYRNVPIDVVPLATGYRNDSEVLVQGVDAPPQTETGGQLPIRVLIRNASPDMAVEGRLVLLQKSDGVAPEPIAIVPDDKGVIVPQIEEDGKKQNAAIVRLKPGLNAFRFKKRLESENKSYTYEAIFTPLARVAGDGTRTAGLPGDRLQNNSATTHVVALGQRKVLLVEPADRKGSHRLLADRLNGKGDRKFRVIPITNAELPADKTELAVFLSNYDCVVLANVPAEELNDDQMEMLRSNTYDQGCGLVMIGGDTSFGAGGWQGTAVEKALPVDCDIKSLKVAGKGGLVLIMHASEMAEGNRWQKEIAKLAIKKLAPADMVGVLYYDFGAAPVWHVKFQQIKDEANRQELLRQVDRMSPGDMPDFDPFLKAAHQELINPKHELAKKHVILISDGDPQQNTPKILADMKADSVSCTTVGVATHGPAQDGQMKKIADGTGGRTYSPKDPKKLPAIYIKETRIVSQSFIHEGKFTPAKEAASGPLDRLPAGLPPLHGFVRTSLKQSPLVQRGIMGPPTLDQEFPVLAWWQYGLGKAVAFTSDARTQEGAGSKQYWDRDWVESDLYLKFWEQAIGWALRGVETGKLTLTTEYRDGKVRVLIDAREPVPGDPKRTRPMTDLKLTGGITPPGLPPGGKPVELKFEQKNAGQYEAEFKADESGSYFINVQSRRLVTLMKGGKEVTEEQLDSVRAGITLPYSPEFADLESNSKLLEQLATITGGRVIREESLTDPAAWREAFRQGGMVTRSLRPVWFWFAALFALGLLLDVAARRVAVEPAEMAAWWTRTWDSLRGRGVAVPAGQFLDRLRNRKEQIGQDIERDRSSRRYDPTTAPAPPPPGPAGELPPLQPPRPRPAAPPRPAASGDGDDFMSRMRKAKRDAMRDRDKPGGDKSAE